MSTPPTDDSDLRSLFDDAVSDVYPEGDTSEIRARAGRASSGRWVPLTLAAAVATVVVARWDGALDMAQAHRELDGGSGPPAPVS